MIYIKSMAKTAALCGLISCTGALTLNTGASPVEVEFRSQGARLRPGGVDPGRRRMGRSPARCVETGSAGSS